MTNSSVYLYYSLNINSGVRSAFSNHWLAGHVRARSASNEVVISMDLSASSESPRRLTRHATQVCGNVLGEEEDDAGGGGKCIFSSYI